MLKNTHFFIVLAVAVVLQTAVLSAIPILDVHYEMLLATTVFIAIKFDWRAGFTSGIWCGFFQDVFSIAPLGLSILLFATAAILAASFQKVIFTQHISTRLFILFSISLIVAIPLMIHRHGFEILFHLRGLLFTELLAMGVVTTLFSIPYYHVLEKWFHDDRYYPA